MLCIGYVKAYQVGTLLVATLVEDHYSMSRFLACLPSFILCNPCMRAPLPHFETPPCNEPPVWVADNLERPYFPMYLVLQVPRLVSPKPLLRNQKELKWVVFPPHLCRRDHSFSGIVLGPFSLVTPLYAGRDVPSGTAGPAIDSAMASS